MKRNLAASLVLLFIIALSVAGATQAWFASGATLKNVFTAGTVILSKPTANVGSPAQSSEMQMQTLSIEGDEAIAPMVVAPTCKTVEWTFQNIGSKRAFVRVKPSATLTQTIKEPIYIALKINIGDESLFLFNTNEQLLPANAEQFIVYYLGDGSVTDPVTGSLYNAKSGNPRKFGTVKIYDGLDGNGVSRLYIEITSDTDATKIYELFLYAGLEGLDDADFEGTYWNRYPINYEGTILSSNGSYLVKEPLFSGGSYNFNIPGTNDGLPFVFERYPENNPIITLDALKARQQTSVINLDPQPCESNEELWHRGSDGWWYYGSKESPCNGPFIVPPGETVEVCFSHCYDGSGGAELVVSLEAEAVQWSNGAIDSTSVNWSHPWKGLSWSPCERLLN